MCPSQNTKQGQAKNTDSKFDPVNGPVPIDGIDPPVNLTSSSWEELYRLAESFRELEIPGPGFCTNCNLKGSSHMHSLEDMYIVMERGQADLLAGRSPKASPILVGVCRSCAPEMYEAQCKDEEFKKTNWSAIVGFLIAGILIIFTTWVLSTMD